MTTTQTLFGGLALVGIIYYGLRALRVSNYWAAVAAAGVPIVAYIVSKSGKWPGADQFAMHIAAYVAAATGLALIGTRAVGAARRMHWAPRALIVFFVVLFFINAALMTIASQGLPPFIASLLLPGERAGITRTAFPGVVPHDRAAAKSISTELEQRQRLAALGWRLDLRGFDDWQAGQQQRIELTIKAAALPRDLKATLELRRSGGREAQLSVPYGRIAPGHFVATITAPDEGSWIAVVELTFAEESLRFEHALRIAQAL